MDRNIEIELIECCSCHIPFWVSVELIRSLKKSKDNFYCPNGHSQVFTGISDAQKIKDATDRANRLQICCVNKAEEITKLEKSIIGHKGAYGKLKKKIGTT